MVAAMVEMEVKAPTPPRAWAWGTIPLWGGAGKPGAGLIYII